VVLQQLSSVAFCYLLLCPVLLLHQAHSCFQKAVMVVGLQHMRKLPATGDNQFAVQPQKLAEAIAADLEQGLIPFYFLGTIGRSKWSLVLIPISCFTPSTQQRQYSNQLLLAQC